VLIFGLHRNDEVGRGVDEIEDALGETEYHGEKATAFCVQRVATVTVGPVERTGPLFGHHRGGFVQHLNHLS
jgi:hypothetical protein